MRKLLFLLIYSFLFSICVTAQKEVVFSGNQNFLVTQYSVQDGLSENNISDILQDRSGYLWIATSDGLNRFDGYDFKVFKYQPGDHTSLSNNKVNDLFEDKDGQLWIATEGGINLFDPTTEEFKHYRHNPSDKNSISHNRIKTIYEDSDGVLWLGGFNGLIKFEKEKEKFQLFQHKETHHRYWETTPSHEISKIIEVENGDLMIGYYGMGIMIFDKRKEEFEMLHVANRPKGYVNDLRAEAFEEGEDGKILVTANGALFFYEEGRKFTMFESDKISKSIHLHNFTVIPTSSGQYLVGGNHNGHGFSLLDHDFQVIDYFDPPNKIVIVQIIKDRAGDLWLASLHQGIFHLNSQGSYFNSYQDSTNYSINALIEIENDKILIGKNKAGPKVFNKKNNSFESAPAHISYPETITSSSIICLHEDHEKNIWFGVTRFGIELYKSKTNTFQYFPYNYNDVTKLMDQHINQIIETKKNEIWVATPSGLSVLFNKQNIQEGVFKRYRHILGDSTSLSNSDINIICQRQNGQIWIGSADGLMRYNRVSDNFIRYYHNIEDSKSINSNNILSLFEDKNQQLWIGTGGGLNKFNDQENSFQQIRDHENFLDGHIYSIREDMKNQLWLSAKKGLIQYNPKTEQSKIFSKKDGLLKSRFSNQVFIISEKTGHIYIGGGNMISVFHPDSIQSNSFIPPVHISSLTVYEEKNKETIETKIKGISTKDKIELSYRTNIFTFELSALNFRNSRENQYTYKLEGLNENWVNIGTKREITFTNLNPGNYTLQIKGSNNDGIWNEEITTLKIKILPPWWKTTWAYLLYGLIFLSILFGIYRALLRRQELQHQLQSEKSEASRLKELDSFKSRLTTNLTHEFRTPLTVILGMVGQIKNNPEKYLDEGTRLIEANGKNLLRLINQLLDLSKLEDQSFQLNLQQSDIIPYLRYVTESFHSYANGKNLSLLFFTPLESLTMDYDVEQIKQIMTNLISNAIKFTPPDGEIVVRAAIENDHLNIEIKDTGIGIATKDLANIFDRFYQVDGSTTREGEGTGIGLAHTKELVKIMRGAISVESKEGKGTSFFVQLPIQRISKVVPLSSKKQNNLDFELSQNSVLKDDLVMKKQLLINGEKPISENRSTVLLIEDNVDVVIYLKSCLSDLYQIDVAYNGRIGIEKALENIPDLIISDVMMPEKDGFEVCDFLKNDERTSHIPILLLTAKADTSSKIAGLKRGADVYLSKPFDKEELLIRLEKLLERQKNMVTYFSSQAISTNSLKTESENLKPKIEVEEAILIEDAFIQKVKKIIEAHYSDEDFGLPQLCQKIRMSRSQLFRKMKALVGTSPSDFIRTYRLEKAKHLLETTDMNVSEVSWKVGFKDLSHFSKSFQAKFGHLPSATNN